ncbi:ribonuclease P protein component [Facilibium subflavum]|uniref:ribonuclease P protein component n=1 Tax=Facilibium subflavum TaxID=2219058 RepID=UPI000E6518C7|nr:ribonuclease P protein component [Facilibium subflavum]
MPLNCLSKKNILSRKQFPLGFSHVTKKIHTRHFTFLLAERQDFDAAIGVIVAKKKVKSAVQRNQCRRIVKEGFRLNKGLFSHAYVIAIATQHAANADKSQLWQSVEHFIEQCAN